MKTPIFDSEGIDKETFAPIQLFRDPDSGEDEVRLVFSDWEWLHDQ
jgi:hypothetical protein